MGCSNRQQPVGFYRMVVWVTSMNRLSSDHQKRESKSVSGFGLMLLGKLRIRKNDYIDTTFHDIYDRLYRDVAWEW